MLWETIMYILKKKKRFSFLAGKQKLCEIKVWNINVYIRKSHFTPDESGASWKPGHNFCRSNVIMNENRRSNLYFKYWPNSHIANSQWRLQHTCALLLQLLLKDNLIPAWLEAPATSARSLLNIKTFSWCLLRGLHTRLQLITSPKRTKRIKQPPVKLLYREEIHYV